MLTRGPGPAASYERGLCGARGLSETWVLFRFCHTILRGFSGRASTDFVNWAPGWGAGDPGGNPTPSAGSPPRGSGPNHFASLNLCSFLFRKLSRTGWPPCPRLGTEGVRRALWERL